jgi:hypothetical protein
MTPTDFAYALFAIAYAATVAKTMWVCFGPEGEEP